MIKKITAALICVFMILALVPFTASAEDTVEFKVCGISQDSKNVNVSIDFKGTKGFNALDLSIKYNSLRLSVEEIQFASGFAEFKKYLDEQNGGIVFNANEDSNPLKVSIATTIPYKVMNNDGSIVRIKFSKIADTNIAEQDIALTVDNCQDIDFKNISTKVSYDLSDGASSSASENTIEREVLPEEKTAQDANTDKKTVSDDKTESVPAVSGTEKTEVKIAQGKTEAETTAEEVQPEKELSNLSKTIVVIIIAVVFLGGIGALIAIILKNKEKNSTPKTK